MAAGRRILAFRQSVPVGEVDMAKRLLSDELRGLIMKTTPSKGGLCDFTVALAAIATAAASP